MHVTSNSPILYFGTPVVLISTLNEDGSTNLGPISSAWWLGWRCMLGLGGSSKTLENLQRTGQCVVNLPSDAQAGAVDAIARTTGSDPVPETKVRRGYRTLREKLERAGLTAVPSEVVDAPRAAECPVQMEATVTEIRPMGRAVSVQVSIERLYLDESILHDGDPDRIDPDKWRPLIMSFQQFYGLRDGKLHSSELGEIPESAYLPSRR